MSELRRDLISGDWVLLAPGRAARPKFLNEKRKLRKPSPKSTCPFENLEKSGNWPPIATYPNEKKWQFAIIPNKYPAVIQGAHASVMFKEGIYDARTAIGTHSLLITRDHNKHFIDLAPAQVTTLFELLRDYHVALAKNTSAAYISSFYNWGPSAGASIWHPHYQILALPIVPEHNDHSIHGEKKYFKKYGTCARCDIMKFEKKKRMRIIAENDHAIAIAPYASKRSFEVSVVPKKHWASFRDASPAAIRDTALLLQSMMRRMKKYLNDPDMNFYIHDTPLDGKDYSYHHWHIELIPRTSTDAGLELSTGIIINTTNPDNAAAILRGEKV
jgi:UDPglucose--hexose-1-phosphate uridylyltransferase